tara:strand:+ start:606 stop:782 length:177 start_codon:yes stop_codon:yes gene_type:complete
MLDISGYASLRIGLFTVTCVQAGNPHGIIRELNRTQSKNPIKDKKQYKTKKDKKFFYV